MLIDVDDCVSLWLWLLTETVLFFPSRIHLLKGFVDQAASIRSACKDDFFSSGMIRNLFLVTLCKRLAISLEAAHGWMSNEPLCLCGCLDLAPGLSGLCKYTQPVSVWVHDCPPWFTRMPDGRGEGWGRGGTMEGFTCVPTSVTPQKLCCLKRTWTLTISSTLCCSSMRDLYKAAEKSLWWKRGKPGKVISSSTQSGGSNGQSCCQTSQLERTAPACVWADRSNAPPRSSRVNACSLFTISAISTNVLLNKSTCIWREFASALVRASVCVCGEPSFSSASQRLCMKCGWWWRRLGLWRERRLSSPLPHSSFKRPADGRD